MSLAGFEHKAIYTAFKTDYVHFEIEEFARGPGDGAATMLLVHARFERWTPSILKDCLKHWQLFRTVVTQDLFASPQVHDAKWEKFITAFGFVPLLDAAPCHDGETRPIWIHYGKPILVIRDEKDRYADEPLGPAGSRPPKGI